MRRLAMGLVLLLATATATAQPRIAIIIDDLGYHRQNGQAIADLPAPVTCAVIPYSPHGRKLAERASRAGKEVLVHLPMAAGEHIRLDRGGLQQGISENELLDTVRQALSQIPRHGASTTTWVVHSPNRTNPWAG